MIFVLHVNILSAPYPGFISDLRGQADHEVIYGELCVKGK